MPAVCLHQKSDSQKWKSLSNSSLTRHFPCAQTRRQDERCDSSSAFGPGELGGKDPFTQINSTLLALPSGGGDRDRALYTKYTQETFYNWLKSWLERCVSYILYFLSELYNRYSTSETPGGPVQTRWLGPTPRAPELGAKVRPEGVSAQPLPRGCRCCGLRTTSALATGLGWGTRWTGFKPWLCLLTICDWSAHLISLGLSFLICKIDSKSNTSCTGLNCVSTKSRPTWNLRMGSYLEIGSLHIWLVKLKRGHSGGPTSHD